VKAATSAKSLGQGHHQHHSDRPESCSPLEDRHILPQPAVLPPQARQLLAIDAGQAAVLAAPRTPLPFARALGVFAANPGCDVSAGLEILAADRAAGPGGPDPLRPAVRLDPRPGARAPGTASPWPSTSAAPPNSTRPSPTSPKPAPPRTTTNTPRSRTPSKTAKPKPPPKSKTAPRSVAFSRERPARAVSWSARGAPRRL
jgi:hypothetical protein